jgi:hypothetical protein
MVSSLALDGNERAYTRTLVAAKCVCVRARMRVHEGASAGSHVRAGGN